MPSLAVSANTPAPAGEPPSRGHAARDKMLLAALDVFGTHGFAAATTRMVAQAAGMNLGAIPYYFGSKDELYVQAAQYLAEHIAQRQAEALRELRRAVAPHSGQPALIEAVVRFMLGQARLLLAGDVPASWVQFFLRAQAEHDGAFERLFTHAVEPAQTTLTAAVARIVGRAPQSTEARTLTFLISQQVMSLRVADAVLRRRLGWQAITPERLDTLLGVLGPALRAQLGAYASHRTP